MILAAISVLLGFLVSWITIPTLISRAAKSGFGVDKPDGARKTHIQGISRLGGLSLALAFGLGTMLAWEKMGQFSPWWKPVLLGPLAMFVLGFVDDFRPLGAKVKLLVQILIAVLVYKAGVKIDSMTYFGGVFAVDLSRWSLVITVFWLISIPNLINLIDGADGLAGGLGAFLFLVLGVVALQSQQWAVVWISMAMMGGILGFLVFNFPPAKIFLGDGGAYLIGSVIATMSLVSSNKGSIAAALLVIVIVLGIPIADTLFALFRRFIKGYPLFHADAGHIHHRLQKIGFSKRRLVLGMYIVFLVLGFFGLSIFWSQGRTLPIVGGCLVLAAVYAVKNLGYVHSWTHFRLKVDLALNRRSQVKYALMAAELLAMEVDRAEKVEEFQILLKVVLKGVGFQMDQIHTHFVPVTLENGQTLFFGIDRESEQEHWENLATLFRGALNRAIRKWPNEQIAA